MEQYNQPMPNPRGIKPFWLVAAIILTAIIVGGAVYLWQNKVAEKLARDFQSQVVGLSNKITSLGQKGQNATSTNCVKEGEEYSNECGDLKLCNKSCCSGLTAVNRIGFNPALGGNGCEWTNSSSWTYVCTYCGNGVCGAGENQCNCPQDCTESSTGQKLTLDILGNMDYYSSQILPGEKIKFVNGSAEINPYGDCSVCYTRIMSNLVTYGDLNNDGQEDAVVVIESYGGGTGFFRDLEFVINQNGKPVVIDMRSLEDRTTINSIIIKPGIVTIDMDIWQVGHKVVKCILSTEGKIQEVQEVN